SGSVAGDITVTNATGAVTVNQGDGGNVAVSDTGVGAAVAIDGGTNISVTDQGTTTIGVNTGPAGQVDINDTGAGAAVTLIHGTDVTIHALGSVIDDYSSGQLSVTVGGTGSGAVSIYGGSSDTVVTSQDGNVVVGGTAGAISVTDTGRGAVTVEGGSDVTIVQTGAVGAILVGDQGPPTGNVNVTQNLSAGATGGSVTVDGGATVAINLNAVSQAIAAPQSGSTTAVTTTLGVVNVNTTATSVTVNETGSIAAVNAIAAVAPTNAVQELDIVNIPFTPAINGLSFGGVSIFLNSGYFNSTVYAEIMNDLSHLMPGQYVNINGPDYEMIGHFGNYASQLTYYNTLTVYGVGGVGTIPVTYPATVFPINHYQPGTPGTPAVTGQTGIADNTITVNDATANANVVINGGTDVTVSDHGTTTIGATTSASGTVTVNDTGSNGAVSVTGGTTDLITSDGAVTVTNGGVVTVTGVSGAGDIDIVDATGQVNVVQRIADNVSVSDTGVGAAVIINGGTNISVTDQGVTTIGQVTAPAGTVSVIDTGV
ncbi:beta strand repeat-containing protein, partial [Novosphingobium acidiphilum]|uniref:beta strand repeat-containing protein n=1 Tax=Novosphingobium acidiphilum TaxID=505248 RepID=UPI00048DF424